MSTMRLQRLTTASLSLLIALAIAAPARAEKPTSTATAASVPEPRQRSSPGTESVVGRYVAPSLKLTGLAGSTTVLVGVEVSLLIGHVFAVGAAGYASAMRVASPPELRSPSSDTYLQLVYGGPRLGGVLRTTEVTNVTFGVILGGGNAHSETVHTLHHRSDQIMIIEPDVC